MRPTESGEFHQTSSVFHHTGCNVASRKDQGCLFFVWFLSQLTPIVYSVIYTIEFQVNLSADLSVSSKLCVCYWPPKSMGDSTKILAPSLCRYRPYYGIIELPACLLIRPAIKPAFFRWGVGIGGSWTP